MKAIGWESRGLETGLAQSLNFLWRGNTYIQSRNNPAQITYKFLYTPVLVTIHSAMWNVNYLKSWSSGAQSFLVQWYCGTMREAYTFWHCGCGSNLGNASLTLGCDNKCNYTHGQTKTTGWAKRATAHNTNKQTTLVTTRLKGKQSRGRGFSPQGGFQK